MFKLREKTGFSCVGGCTVFDEKGNVFYEKRDPGISFNLPAGTYETFDKIKQLKKPVKFSVPALPKKEKRAGKLPKMVDVRIGSNPHKASIWTAQNRVLFDYDIAAKPKHMRTFVFLHELGHYFYKSENKADHFACYMMIKKGYNPSQVHDAASKTLSKKNYERILKNFNNLKRNA